MGVSDRMRSRPRWGWLFAGIWLFYLGENLGALRAQPPGWPRDVGLAALAGFAACYLLLLHRLHDIRVRHLERNAATIRTVWLGLITLLALAALQAPGAGQHTLTCVVYAAAAAMVGLPLRQGVPFAAACVLGTELLARLVPGWHDAGYGLAVLLGSAACWGLRLAGDRQHRLVQAQDEIAALAVSNERARIAADLHDILGHSLTVVTLKAELAQRLLDVDIERARAELAELEVLARDALADVRSTALGVRGISLPGEIAAARSALDAAHVTARLPTAADEVPTRWRELFAWTIREAVTNVVRHSGATRCEILLAATSVEIIDDGTGEPPARAHGQASAGQGLAGLRRRAAAADATLVAGRRDDRPGFRVRMQVPS